MSASRIDMAQLKRISLLLRGISLEPFRGTLQDASSVSSLGARESSTCSTSLMLDDTVIH